MTAPVLFVIRRRSPTSRRGPAKCELVEGWFAGTARRMQDWPASFAMVAAETVVPKVPAAFGATFAFSSSATVPSQRMSTFAVLPFDVPATARLAAPVDGYVMNAGSAGVVMCVSL